MIIEDFENYLLEKIREGIPSRTKEAMEYSLMGKGKRIRPRLLFSALNAYGVNPKKGFAAACAIEMIHTYSLIHDDLPAMDNDDLRRGRLTCHKQFDEATAILAGDGLLTKAFEVVLQSPCTDEIKVNLVMFLSRYAGSEGMIYGQDLDIRAENSLASDFNQVKEIDIYKTGKLLTLPLVFAALLANHSEDIRTMNEIGDKMGIFFQIQDDILDVTKSSEQIGKTTSDQENNKMTAISILGLNKAKELVEKYSMDIYDKLGNLHLNDASFLKEFMEQLLKRSY